MKAELFIAKYKGQDTSKRIKKEYTGYGSTEMESLTNLFWEMMDDSRSHFKVAVLKLPLMRMKITAMKLILVKIQPHQPKKN